MGTEIKRASGEAFAGAASSLIKSVNFVPGKPGFIELGRIKVADSGLGDNLVAWASIIDPETSELCHDSLMDCLWQTAGLCDEIGAAVHVDRARFCDMTDAEIERALKATLIANHVSVTIYDPAQINID